MQNVQLKIEIDKLKQAFLSRRDQILSKPKEELDLTARDSADKVQNMLIASTLEALTAREREAINKINHALSKIASGTFGLCEECEELIAAPRLLAVPDCKFCIHCAERNEWEAKQNKVI